MTKLNKVLEVVVVNGVEIDKVVSDKLNTFQQVSSKVRYLHSLNFDRSKIKNVLNIRYQHVRNILITPVKTPKNK